MSKICQEKKRKEKGKKDVNTRKKTYSNDKQHKKNFSKTPNIKKKNKKKSSSPPLWGGQGGERSPRSAAPFYCWPLFSADTTQPQRPTRKRPPLARWRSRRADMFNSREKPVRRQAARQRGRAKPGRATSATCDHITPKVLTNAKKTHAKHIFYKAICRKRRQFAETWRRNEEAKAEA